MQKLKIHNEGKVYFILAIITTIVTLFFFQIIGILFLILTFYIFYFFRDPDRYIPNEDVILSPADGIVTFIGSSNAPIDISKEKFIKISIFLNIFDVHVNRMPTSGLIKKIEYIPGKFINASFDKSSDDNERNIIFLEKKNNDIFFITQIAGLIARRIVCEIKKNQSLNKGDRFGIIKFGSRVDLYMPSNYKPLVTIGQRVIGGETILSNPNNILEIRGSIKK